MPPQTRKLLVLLHDQVKTWAGKQAVKPDELHFTRREVRAALGWGDTQLKIHLARLLEMEYLLLHRRGLTYEYQLLWDGGDGEEAHLCGLLDVATSETQATDGKGKVSRPGSEADRSDKTALQSAPGRGQVGGRSARGKAASGHAAQGPESKPVGPEPGAVIRKKKKTLLLPSTSLPQPASS